MTITPPLIHDDEAFAKLSNRLAQQLSTAFGYSLPEAEDHVRDCYQEYEASIPDRRRSLREAGVTTELEWSARDHFWHEDSALVLHIGYRLAGGDPNGAAFLEWRKTCWDALRSGGRVPSPTL